ncbi:DUF1893 domain-containing protein [Candidatus Stoquefichus massiliensis]|uniref:DUF1893 domain-containing protein n=1 Tax=Candidatus Stoquefichus massiliensis TaxID=1470350 RepID=UPI00048167F6|nr:DUF1893 domain-containing protein [Candidatus Stoquefichus massiliensis]
MNLNMLQNKLKDENYTLIADINGVFYTSHQRGIAPILNPMKEQIDFFKDAIVVDKVIGKATAMLLILSGVQYIYAYVLSQKAKDILDWYHIDYGYDKIVEYIQNRDKSGMCPMEKTVYDINDLQMAFEALKNKQKELQGV